jgi:hypothetical protein
MNYLSLSLILGSLLVLIVVIENPLPIWATSRR